MMQLFLWQKKALELAKSDFGPEHFTVSISLNNLASLYRTKGLYDRAESLYEQALTILEKLYGSNHPKVATALDNLVGLYEGNEENIIDNPSSTKNVKIKAVFRLRTRSL